MPRNGGGGYNLPPGINPVVTQTLITTNWANTTMNDLAAAITQSLSKDGQTTPTANLPMGGFKHTNVADPTARNEYATLGYVQDGTHMRLTSVVGTDVIKANLPGGDFTPVLGQLVQLVPTGPNTTALVTLSVNGGSARSILTQAGNGLNPGNLQAGKPYLLSYDGDDWLMISAPDENNFAQSAMSGWFRPSPSNVYPDITIVNPSTVHIPAGRGRIVAPGATDIAGVKDIQWAAQDVVISNLALSWATTLGINNLGQVVQFTGNVQSAWARNNVILGVVGHVNGTVTNVVTRPTIYGDMVYAAYDLATLFHNLLVAGGKLGPNGVNPLHLDISAGTVWLLGSNPDSTDSPNFYTFPTFLDMDFYPITGNNSVGAITSAVPTTVYDLNGNGITSAIPGGATTTVIHRMFVLANQFLFLYGQRTYADLNTALAQIQADDSLLVTPTKLVDATFIGYVIAQKNTAGFNDQATSRLVSAGNATFTIGSAGSIGDAPIDGSSYGRNNAAWQKVVDQIQPGANVTVNNANPNKPSVAVPSGNLVAGEGATFSGSAGADRLLGAGNLTITGAEGFRNKVINGNFDIWQRLTNSPIAAAVRYGADRWNIEATNSQAAVVRQAFAPGQTDVPGFPNYYHRLTNTSVAGGTTLIATHLEDVTQYAGRTITVSWWAKADANRAMAIDFSQRFGGGSGQVIVPGVKVNLTTSWQKFSATIAMPSAAGKVLGALTSVLKVFFWYDSSPATDPRTFNLGQQSGIFDIAQVQIEYGPVATNFELRPKGVELALCQRYFEKSYNQAIFPGALSSGPGRMIYGLLGLVGTQQSWPVRFATTKCSNPRGDVQINTIYSWVNGTVGMVSQVDGSDVAGPISWNGESGFEVTWTNTAGQNGGRFHWTSSAELDNIV